MINDKNHNYNDKRHQKKQMFCVFWTAKGPIHWELLDRGQTVTSEIYCNQLEQVNVKYDLWRQLGRFNGPLVFQQDNAPPHRSQTTNNFINHRLRWDVIPAYSPDLAPSDYHLFLSLKNFLRDRRFDNQDQVKAALEAYFATKIGTDFYERGIRKLPFRWQYTINSHGNYFLE